MHPLPWKWQILIFAVAVAKLLLIHKINDQLQFSKLIIKTVCIILTNG